jgi:peptidoglycan/LPS O-acetylase OafA/YrhL
MRDPLAQTWSLSVEEQFYLLWPVLLLAALRHRGMQSAFSVAAVLALAALIDRGLLVGVLHASAARIYFGSDTNAFALMTGCGLALARCQGRVPRVDRIALAYTCVAVAFLVVTASPNGADLFSLLGPAVVTIATALLIARLVTAGAGGFLTWRPVRGLGRISYSLYLWQTPVIVWGDVWLGSTPAVLRVALLTSLSLACACVSYRYVEAPLRNLGRLPSPYSPEARIASTSASRASIGSAQ